MKNARKPLSALIALGAALAIPAAFAQDATAPTATEICAYSPSQIGSRTTTSNRAGLYSQATIEPTINKPATRMPIRRGHPSRVRSSGSPDRCDLTL